MGRDERTQSSVDSSQHVISTDTDEIAEDGSVGRGEVPGQGLGHWSI